MKVKVLDKNGIIVAGKLVKKGELVEVGKAQLEVLLHFKQAEAVSVTPPAPAKEPDKKPADGEDGGGKTTPPPADGEDGGAEKTPAGKGKK